MKLPKFLAEAETPRAPRAKIRIGNPITLRTIIMIIAALGILGGLIWTLAYGLVGLVSLILWSAIFYCAWKVME